MTPPAPRRVKDLFVLPESVLKASFVEKLSEAVNEPARVAESYVVTPGLVQAFDRGLTFVGRALSDKRSTAAFVHGSFGSGKSHFMAMLHFLVSGNEHAWRIPELHALRDKHPFCGKAKVLPLTFHMVGHTSLTEAIAHRYLAYVREHHPDAPVPPVFADEALFEDAERLLERLGEEKFFEPMNALEGHQASEGWGALGDEGRWDAARFRRFRSASDPKERGELFSDLVRTHFVSFAQGGQRFLSLDACLAAVSRHAERLGYQAILLYLDELILWLASQASNLAWFHNEVQEMVKLVEAEAARPVPFVSFIARQRDLSEMVGRDFEGQANALVRDSFKWSEGRYETIRLEERNLVDIAEKRILKTKDEASKKALETAFESMRRQASEPAWRAMLGSYDPDEFRKLYPFSPSLVHALVGLSNALQRERTAIKLLTEILVEHIEDVELGGIVGVGDLFDVIAGGEDTADGPMKARFDAARHLYRHQLLPLVQEKHGTNTKELCQRLRPEHPVRIGCSNCRQKACRTDNRLLKTMLVAALVPEIETLKNLTASRVVALNHGSLKTPIPGTEGAEAAQRLRGYAAQLGQLHVGSEADPTVRVQIEGVDVRPILSAHQSHDTPGQRQRLLREQLFGRLGLDNEKWTSDGLSFDTEWRGTRRRGLVRFGNVRKMSDDVLRCDEASDYRIVIDYPFDDPEFSPADDEEVVQRFRDEGGSWTLAWLPTFFSGPMKDLLGDLVVLEHILGSADRRRSAVAHLSTENQVRALHDLENLQNQKLSRLNQGLEQAYGLARAEEGTLDPSFAVERHLHILRGGVDALEPRLASNLTTALGEYARALLDKRYPRHPTFPRKVTPHAVKEALELFRNVSEADQRRVVMGKTADVVNDLLAPLGLARAIEGTVAIAEDRTLATLERERMRRAAERPMVSQLREMHDETRQMGLPVLVEDLVIRCYALFFGRELVLGGKPYDGEVQKALPGDVVLERPDLPSPEAWSKARQLASELVGFASPRTMLSAENLRALETGLAKEIEPARDAALKLPEVLARGTFGAALAESAHNDRLTTARATAELLKTLGGLGGRVLIEALVGATMLTSPRAVGRSLKSARANLGVLENRLTMETLERAMHRRAESITLGSITDKTLEILRQDELNTTLGSELGRLAEQAGRELARIDDERTPPPPRPGPSKGRVLLQKSVEGLAGEAALAATDSLARELRELLAKHPNARVRIDVVVDERDD